MKMRDKNKLDRPREKLKARGAQSLSDIELLEAIIGSGVQGADVTKIARTLHVALADSTSVIDYDFCTKITGLGQAKISQILATLELGRRYYATHDQPVIDSPEKAVEQLADIRPKQQEHFICLTLDGANRLISKHTITIGTLTASLVHPREVFAPAIADRAASIIVSHNHPSGSLDPSPADLEVTDRLRNAGQLLGITLADHLIVTKTSHRSII